MAAITKMDGYVLYEWEFKNGNIIQGDKPHAPKWLVDTIGVDYFGDVVCVVIRDASNDALFQVGRLNKVQKLLIGDNSQMTDAGLAHLEHLTNLASLDLTGTSVTDVGLEHLKGLSNLAQLNLARTTVSDAGLPHLKGLISLVELNLGATRVTNAGLAQLKFLTSLRKLYLNGTQVNDVGISQLKEPMPDLEVFR